MTQYIGLDAYIKNCTAVQNSIKVTDYKVL
jgi:hypothetical protein